MDWTGPNASKIWRTRPSIASCLMCAYNQLNGVPMCAPIDLLQKTRDEWGSRVRCLVFLQFCSFSLEPLEMTGVKRNLSYQAVLLYCLFVPFSLSEGISHRIVMLCG
jgi:hypothetical protein